MIKILEYFKNSYEKNRNEIVEEKLYDELKTNSEKTDIGYSFKVAE